MSKFTTSRIPLMKPKNKAKRLGLLTKKKRVNATYRFKNETVERLNTLLERLNDAMAYKISKTDIIESLIMHANTVYTNTELKRILGAYFNKLK